MNNCFTCGLQEKGECHLSPPMVHDEQSFPKRGMYPKVTESDWCGQWQAKAEVIEDKPIQPFMAKVTKKMGRPRRS